MTFEVAGDASADEVKMAVQAVFGVKVDKVNIVNVRPRDKRSTRYAGKVPGFKKAYVKVNKDYNLGEIAKAAAADEKK
jgi:large subunit ribosomal protein L23